MPRDWSALWLLGVDADVDATRAWRGKQEAGGGGRKALEGNAMKAIITHAWRGRCGGCCVWGAFGGGGVVRLSFGWCEEFTACYFSQHSVYSTK